MRFEITIHNSQCDNKFHIFPLFFVLFCTLDWESEAVDKAEILRLIYQGRFLHCNVTLGALGLPLGKTTVMHLVPRDNLPEPNSQGRLNFKKKLKVKSDIS